MTIRRFPLSQNASTQDAATSSTRAAYNTATGDCLLQPCYGTSGSSSKGETLGSLFDSRSGNMLRLLRLRTLLSFQSSQLTALIHTYAVIDSSKPLISARAMPRAPCGLRVFRHVAERCSRGCPPRKIIVLECGFILEASRPAILSSGAWRTPLGDARIDEELAEALKKTCPQLREDSVAHSAEHSLEVQLPFLQVLVPEFTFVPVALGTMRFESLVERRGSDRASIGGFERACIATDDFGFESLTRMTPLRVSKTTKHRSIAEAESRGCMTLAATRLFRCAGWDRRWRCSPWRTRWG